MRNEQEKVRRKKEEDKKKAFKPRMIVHPQFQNVSVDEAIKVILAHTIRIFHAGVYGGSYSDCGVHLSVFDKTFEVSLRTRIYLNWAALLI